MKKTESVREDIGSVFLMFYQEERNGQRNLIAVRNSAEIGLIPQHPLEIPLRATQMVCGEGQEGIRCIIFPKELP
ncbi:hypothetical protein [Gorillibacterium massiliense]|uniref:hypothetical protein n=1 Tax=Gorillibacterium massiliense TaxID=1280390 RepID=UPI00059427B3|nr:hypothetical protein [Gorillibacterium massiliense]